MVSYHPRVLFLRTLKELLHSEHVLGGKDRRKLFLFPMVLFKELCTKSLIQFYSFSFEPIRYLALIFLILFLPPVSFLLSVSSILHCILPSHSAAHFSAASSYNLIKFVLINYFYHNFHQQSSSLLFEWPSACAN